MKNLQELHCKHRLIKNLSSYVEERLVCEQNGGEEDGRMSKGEWLVKDGRRERRGDWWGGVGTRMRLPGAGGGEWMEERK